MESERCRLLKLSFPEGLPDHDVLVTGDVGRSGACPQDADKW